MFDQLVLLTMTEAPNQGSQTQIALGAKFGLIK